MIAGEKWIWNTADEWQREHFPFWCVRTVKTIIRNLEKRGLLLACQPDGRMSRKKYYRLNPEEITRLGKSCTINEANSAPSHQAGVARSLTETTTETSESETTRKDETNGDKSPVCLDFEIPTLAEVNRHYADAYTHKQRITNKAAAESWFMQHQSRGWKTAQGQRIRNWRKALDGWIKHFQPPQHDKETKWADLQEYAEEIGMTDSQFLQYMRYRNRDGWMAENPVTGKEEPIRDRKANMEAFFDSLTY